MVRADDFVSWTEDEKALFAAQCRADEEAFVHCLEAVHSLPHVGASCAAADGNSDYGALTLQASTPATSRSPVTSPRESADFVAASSSVSVSTDSYKIQTSSDCPVLLCSPLCKLQERSMTPPSQSFPARVLSPQERKPVESDRRAEELWEQLGSSGLETDVVSYLRQPVFSRLRATKSLRARSNARRPPSPARAAAAPRIDSIALLSRLRCCDERREASLALLRAAAAPHLSFRPLIAAKSKRLAEWRCTPSNTAARRQRTVPPPPTFIPQISARSRALRREVDELLVADKRRLWRLRMEEDAVRRAESAKCTFSPQISKRSQRIVEALTVVGSGHSAVQRHFDARRAGRTEMLMRALAEREDAVLAELTGTPAVRAAPQYISDIAAQVRLNKALPSPYATQAALPSFRF